MWPLLIVICSALLPGKKLRWWHVAGGVAGLAGSIILVTGGELAGFKAEYWLGYAVAVALALTWTAYSISSRHISHVPSDAVGVFLWCHGRFGKPCPYGFRDHGQA